MIQETRLNFLLPLLRIFVASVGVILAIFFQAWGLPIFLIFILVLSWLIRGGKNYKIGLNSGLYIVLLTWYFVAMIILIPLASFGGDLIRELSKSWDNISLVVLQTPDLKLLPYASGMQSYQYIQEARILSVKLVLNIIALMTPIILACCLSFKLRKVSTVSFHHAPPLMYRLIIVCALFALSIFSLWGMEHIKINDWRIARLLFILYYFPTIIPFFFFKTIIPRV